MPDPTESPDGGRPQPADSGRVVGEVVAETADPPVASAVAAFFDVDNTIIRGASAFHLGVGLYRRGFFRTGDIIRFGLHQARYLMFGESKQQISEVRDRALSIMRGRSVAEVLTLAEDVYDEVLSLRIFPGTQRLLDQHLRAGHQVWLVTATPVEIGDLIARRLGANGALGTIAEHTDGFYTGRLVGDMMHGQAKAEGVRTLAEKNGLDLSQSFAYGDSANDVPLLSEVGFPCAINPDGRLRRHAAEVGWPMREFRNRRARTRRGVDAATAAGSIWALALVARAVQRQLRSRWGR
ncbi:hydrolase [Cellulomonas denverensis]|nr:hydrolase [Cellulomonas denverensis]